MQILKWTKTIWDLDIQQASVCLCIPRWLDRLPLTLPGFADYRRYIFIEKLQEEYTYTGITGGLYLYRNYRRKMIIQELQKEYTYTRITGGNVTGCIEPQNIMSSPIPALTLTFH